MSEVRAVTVYERCPEAKDGWFPHWRYNAAFISPETALRLAAIHAYNLGSDIRVVGPDGAEYGIVTVEQARKEREAEMLGAEPLDDAELAAIRRRAAFVPGTPWIERRTNRLGHEYGLYVVPGVEWTDDATGGIQDFIAHSNIDVGRLLEEVDRLRAELGAAKRAQGGAQGPGGAPAD
jgi:hypothetical protein